MVLCPNENHCGGRLDSRDLSQDDATITPTLRLIITQRIGFVKAKCRSLGLGQGLVDSHLDLKANFFDPLKFNPFQKFSGVLASFFVVLLHDETDLLVGFIQQIIRL